MDGPSKKLFLVTWGEGGIQNGPKYSDVINEQPLTNINMSVILYLITYFIHGDRFPKLFMHCLFDMQNKQNDQKILQNTNYITKRKYVGVVVNIESLCYPDHKLPSLSPDPHYQ